MTEESIYTIIIQKKRVKVSREVYYAYHKAREAERYQNRIIRKSELSLERFREEGVYVEFRANDSVPEMEEKMIRDEERHRLYQALDELSVDERMLIESLFFSGIAEGELAAHLGITQQAVSRRKIRILRKLRKKIE